MSTYYADYPIFGSCCTKDGLILSGGGGGKDYGIEDQIELYELTNYSYMKENKVEINLNDKFTRDSSIILRHIYSTTKQNGLIDSMCYNGKFNLVAGGIKNTCVLFFIEETKEGKFFRMYLQFQTIWDENKKGKQNICRFSKNSKLLITGGTDKIVRVWELNCSARSTNEIVPVQMKEFYGHEEEILDIDMTYDNIFLISTNRNGTILIHDYQTAEIVKKFSVPMKNGNFIVRQCRFIENDLRSPKKQRSNDRKQYLVSFLLHELRGPSYITTWNMKVSKENVNTDRILFAQLFSTYICDKPSSVLATSDDYTFLAVGTNTGLIKLFKNGLNELKLIKQGNFHDLPVTGLNFYNSNEYVVSTGADYSISIMNVFSKKNEPNLTKGFNGIFRFGIKAINYFILITVIILFSILFINYCINIGNEIQNSFDQKEIIEL